MRTLLVLAAAILLMGAHEAAAAPQILAVLAPPAPVPLVCADGTCRAQLATVCLQRHRDVPVPGRGYREAVPGSVVVVGRDAAGRIVRRPLSAASTIAATRGYTAVAVTPAAADLAGLAAPALEVAPGAALVPTAVAGDPDPLSPAEVAYATGPLRALASRVFERHAGRRDAALLLGRLIDGTPETGRMPAGERDTLWQRVGADRAPGLSPVGVGQARTIYGACQRLTEMAGFFSLRRCLAHRQDEVLMNLNTHYWDAAEPGS